MTDTERVTKSQGDPRPASLPAGWRGLAAEAAQALRFYSRLPVPALPFEADPHGAPDFATLPRLLPLVGAVLGAVGALVLGAGAALHLPPLASAALAVAAMAAATGAMAEDALADACDGLFGGFTVERRLEIMRDSRVGSYGVTALTLALLLRTGALAALLVAAGPGAAGAALVAAAALSRVAGAGLLWALPPARTDGRSAAVGRPSGAVMAQAGLLAAGLTLVVAAPALGWARALAAIAGAALAAAWMGRLARRRLGGQTGDIAGAAQHLAEVAALLALAAGASP